MWRARRLADPASSAARRCIVAAIVVFGLIACHGNPFALFDHGGAGSNFYDEQARSLLRLHLWVRRDIASIEGFDMGGHTYLYYGPFLALTRLPFALFGNVFFDRMSRVSLVVAYGLLCTGAFHLVRSRTASTWRTVAAVLAVAVSPALSLAGWISVYNETELWAAALATWAFVGVVRLIDEPSCSRHAWWCGLSIAAATLTRVPIGIGVGLACVVVVVCFGRGRSGTSRREHLRPSRIVLSVAAAGLFGHVAVNYGRFGSLFSFPADKQILTIIDPRRAAWFAGNHGSFFGLRFLPTTVVHYLRPDSLAVERLWPFVRFGSPAVDRGSYPMESITPSSSLTASATLLFIAAVVGAVVIVRRREWRWALLSGGALVATVPTFTIGFIANRYLVDMLPALIVPATLAFAHVATPALWSWARWSTVSRVGMLMLAAWGLWCNSALALWSQQLREPGFTSLRYRLDGLLFGRPSPSLARYVAGGLVPHDGSVVVAGDAPGSCEGVYIAENGVWIPLERPGGIRELRGTIAPSVSGPTSLVGGEDWVASVERVPGGFRASVDVGGVRSDGQPVNVSDEASVRVRVVVDDVTHEFRVDLDGRLSLATSNPPSLPMTPFAALATDPPSAGSLCHRLLGRL